MSKSYMELDKAVDRIIWLHRHDGCHLFDDNPDSRELLRNELEQICIIPSPIKDDDFWLHANSANAIRGSLFLGIEKHSRNSYQNNMNLFMVQWISHLNDMILILKKELEKTRGDE